MKDNGWGYLEHMLQACADIEEFCQECTTVDDFVANKMMRSAVTMELLNLGELVKKTAELGTIDGTDVLWKNIIRFRDRTSHWYHTTDFSTVWSIVENRIPKIYDFLKQQQQQVKSISEIDIF